MKLLLLAVLAIIVFSALVQSVSVTPKRNVVCTKRSLPGQPKATQEVIEFVEGFFLGIESDIGLL